MTRIRIDSCPICKGNHFIHRISYTDSISGEVFEILQCSDCGLHVTQDAPRREEMERYYPNDEDLCYRPTQNSSEKWIEHLLAGWYREQVKRVRTEADRLSGVLLEMGCKQGYFANAIRNSGWIAHAVESDTRAREYANKRFLLQVEPGKRFFDIHARSYNVVVAWDTLGEAIDLHRTLDKLKQLIVSDGTIIIAFHNAMGTQAGRMGAHWAGWDAPRKRWHLTPSSFEKLVEQHHLEIVNCSTSARRSFITSVTTLWQAAQGKKILKPTIDSLTQRDNDTYYIYTLKGKTE